MTPIFQIPRPAAWTTQTACTLDDYDRLDPVVGARPTRRELTVRRRAAEQLCARCPVAVNCAADADAYRDPGVRGGSLRLQVAGRYVAVPLVRQAVPSIYDADGGIEVAMLFPARSLAGVR
jgi:hypothetical protein